MALANRNRLLLWTDCLKVTMDTRVFPARDTLVMPLWLLANCLLLCVACRLSRAIDRDALLPRLALSGALIYAAIIVGVTMTLGCCGLLDAKLLLFLMMVVCVTGLFVLRRARSEVSVGSRPASGLYGDEHGEPTGARRVGWLWGIWIVVLGCLLGHVAVNGLLAFPTEWDGLVYHIPIIDYWLQAKNLYVPDCAWWWAPCNAELVGLWMVAPFSGDFLIALGNLPFLVLWVLAAVEAGRVIGLSDVWRHLAALTMIAIHTTFHESEKAMNDLAVVACFFAAVAYGLRYLQSRQTSHLALAGIAIGLLAGVKYFALGYAALVVGVLVGAAVMLWGWREAARLGVLLTLFALPLGGYWYLRNFWLTGAPLYPQWSAAGMGYPNLWQTAFIGNSNPELVPLAVRALWIMTGPCHAAAVALLPITAVALIGGGVQRLRQGRREEAAVLWALCALLAGSAAVFACTPMALEDQPGTLNHLRWAYTPARYGLCFLSTAALAFVWLLQQVSAAATSLVGRWFPAGSRWPRFVTSGPQAILAAAIAWQLWLRLAYLHDNHGFGEAPNLADAGLAGLNVTAFCWLLLEVYRHQSRHRVAIAAVMAVSLLVASSTGAALLSRRWHEGYARHFDTLRGTRVFSKLANRSPLKIAVLDHRPYPFIGSARQHRICAPRTLTTYDELTHYLAARQPDIMASPVRNTGNVYDRYKPGPEWLKTHPAQFPPLETSGGFALFSFDAPRSSAVSVNDHGK